ncbi:MAG: hypothetical protein JJT81_01660 [Rubellimicrobium sp.]|nr:hypothetical protein [Rubellimicrobium sp.]
MTRLAFAVLFAIWPLGLVGQEATDANPTREDLRALQFYLQQNDTVAVEAEFRRLQAAFPSWTPPADLASLARLDPDVEIDRIYARINAGDPAGARRLLTETRAAFPFWTPTQDLVSAVALAEAQAAFDAAIAARDLEAAVRIAVESPGLSRCERINNIWLLSELQTAAGNTAAALAGYRQIVSTCAATQDVVSTIEKASAIATPDQVQALIETAEGRGLGQPDVWRSLSTRLAGTQPPAGTPATPPTPQPAAPATTAAPQPQTTAPAPRQQAVAPPAPPVAGAVLAAPATAAPTATVASPSSLNGLRRSGDSRINNVRQAAAAGDFRTCTRLSTRPASLDIAYERAWCVYNLDRPLEALALFSAVAQGGLGGTVPRDARYGMMLSYLELQMTEAAARLAAETDLTFEQRKTVEGIILDQRGVRSYEQGHFLRAITFFDALEQLDGTLRRDLRLLRGYAYLNSGQRARAMEEFVRLNNELATSETREALRIARQ